MSPANLATPYYDDGGELTCYCSVAVIGKRFVKISGPRQAGNPRQGVTDAVVGGNITVAPCAAGDDVFGVAAHDADVGTLVTVYRGKKIVPVQAGAALTAGDVVEAGAAGVAVVGDEATAAGVSIDTAVSGADAQIALA